MPQVSLEDAAARLPQLIAEVNQGEEVVLTQDSLPVALLVAVAVTEPQRGRRKAGTAKGMGYMTADFDAPIEDFAEFD